VTPSLSVRLARRARHEARRAARIVGDLRRRREIVRTPPARGVLRVSYGYDALPGRNDVAFGGMVKFGLLSESMPNAPRDFNVLYLGSSSMPLDARLLVGAARRRGAAFVWNQNGVAYPGWFGPGYEKLNRPRAQMLHRADHVVYQSTFCKVSADRFLGERVGSWEILHNPVDTRLFTPATRPRRPLTLLLGGNQYQRYRLDVALLALAALPEARLVVTGALSWAEDAEREAARLLARSGVAERVAFVGTYTQLEAPAVIQRGDILLHTKYNDPCPTVVLEAMAGGLPVVYSASGGTPELVGPDAGVGLTAPLDWEHDHPPDPGELAEAVATVAERLDEFAEAARARAEEFDVRPWIERHRQVFETLVGLGPG